MNIFEFLIFFPMLIIAMSVHEFSHGLIAYKLGDPTAKYSGRLTLNPLAHIDIIGTVVIPLMFFISTGFVFGYAKPVPVNFQALRNPRRDIIWVGISGPAVNILLAFLTGFILKIFNPQTLIYTLLANFAIINVILGVFNLIPIPPLDGSRVIMGILPRRAAMQYAMLEPVGFIILLALLFTGVIHKVIWPVIDSILKVTGVSN